MLFKQGLVALAVSVAIPICSATKVLPQGRLAAVDIPAAAGIYEVTVNISDRPDAVPYPRLRLPIIPVQKPLRPSEPSPAQVKRTLLGARQYCDDGYGYCYASGTCCPDDEGECCDDGTCVTVRETCCLTGGACGEGRDCCEDGCKERRNTCCLGGGSCQPGRDCCGNGYCSPKGGECCSDGTVCDTGLICVILNGERGCCKDLSCSEHGGTVGDTGSESSPSTRVPVSITPTITPINTPPPPVLKFYTTTWIWFYYSYYLSITYIPVSTTRTLTVSTRVTTTITVSVEASASAAAQSLFDELSDVSAAVMSRTSFTGPAVTETAAESDTASIPGPSLTLPSLPSVSDPVAPSVSSPTLRSISLSDGSSPTGSAGATASSSAPTGVASFTGGGSLAPAGPRPAAFAGTMGLVAVAMVIGAGMVLL